MASAEILARATTLALDAIGVTAALLVGHALAARTIRARRGRRGRRFFAACALATCVAGVGFATIASRADEPEYDEAAVLATRVREATGRVELPDGFQLAQASPLDAIDPLKATVFLDARGLHVGDRSFDLDEAPLGSMCSVPMPVVQALEWERRLARAIVPTTESAWEVEEINLAIDAETPYRSVVKAWRWLTCERLVPALVLAEPGGALGVLRFDAPYYRGYDVRFRIAVAPDGYRVVRDNGWEKMWGYRWVMDGIPASGTVSYGAGCTPDADGASVSLHGDATALAECIWTAFDDEARVRHVDLESFDAIGLEVTGPPPPPPSRKERWSRLYSTCGNSPALAYAVSATPEMAFGDVAPAVLAVKPMASFAGFDAEP